SLHDAIVQQASVASVSMMRDVGLRPRKPTMHEALKHGSRIPNVFLGSFWIENRVCPIPVEIPQRQSTEPLRAVLVEELQDFTVPAIHRMALQAGHINATLLVASKPVIWNTPERARCHIELAVIEAIHRNRPAETA